MDLGIIIVAIVLIAGTIFGLVRMRTDGRVNLQIGPQHVHESELGHGIGSKATVLQFSSPHCQPCKATHDLIEKHTKDLDGVAHIDLQVADHLDMVNKLQVMRTPTTVLLDAKGAVRFRADGVPRMDEFATALNSLIAH